MCPIIYWLFVNQSLEMIPIEKYAKWFSQANRDLPHYFHIPITRFTNLNHRHRFPSQYQSFQCICSIDLKTCKTFFLNVFRTSSELNGIAKISRRYVQSFGLNPIDLNQQTADWLIFKLIVRFLIYLPYRLPIGLMATSAKSISKEFISDHRSIKFFL